MSIIPRRSFLRSIPASLLAVLGLGRAKAATTRIKPVIGLTATPLKPVVALPSRGPDVIVAIRNMFANRNPLVARMHWVPVERVDFRLCSHRFATAEEMPYHDKVTHGGRCGLTTVAEFRTQYCQDFHHPVPVSTPDDMEFNKQVQLQNLVDDMEVAMYYGEEDGSDLDRLRTGGLRSLLKTNLMVKRFAPGEEIGLVFFVEAIQRCVLGGGNPDTILASPDMVKRLDRISILTKIPAGDTTFGTPISVYRSDELDGFSIVECPLLMSRTTCVLTSSEVYVRNKIDPHFSGKIMDDGWCEGWKATMAIEVINEQHHCWAEARRV